MADRRYHIPAERQADVLRLHYTGHSDRQVFLTLYPQSRGSTAGTPKLGTFCDALHELIRQTEESCRALALREKVPFVRPSQAPDDAGCAELCLSEPVGEEPLAPGDEEALADLDAGRAALCSALRDLTDPANSPPEPPPPEAGRWCDPLAERAKVIALLGNALSANVSVRLRGAATRVARTVTLHNLRLARKEEEAGGEGASSTDSGIPTPAYGNGWHRSDPATGHVPSPSRTAPATSGFILDVPRPS